MHIHQFINDVFPSNSGANTSKRENTAELCFQNPTYSEMSTKKQVTLNETEATYDMVTSPNQTTSGMSANGQNYAKLNRAVRNGKNSTLSIILRL